MVSPPEPSTERILRQRGGWLRALARRHPFIMLFLLAVVSNLSGSFFNIAYNTYLIVHGLLNEEQVWVFEHVALPLYNVIAYPAGLGVLVYLLWPLIRCRARLRRGEALEPEEMAFCHKRLVNLPFCMVCVN